MLEWRSVSDCVKTMLDLLWLGKTVPTVFTFTVKKDLCDSLSKGQKMSHWCTDFFFFLKLCVNVNFFFMYDWLTVWLPLFLWRLTLLQKIQFCCWPFLLFLLVLIIVFICLYILSKLTSYDHCDTSGVFFGGVCVLFFVFHFYVFILSVTEV